MLVIPVFVLMMSFTDGSTLTLEHRISHAVFAQSSNNVTTGSQTLENTIPVPGWVRNNTGMWGNGKLNDSQFILGMRYLVANDVAFLPPEYINSALQKPVPSWIKNVATWWANGKISDYDFLSDIQYLVNNDVIKLQPTGNQTGTQDTSILSNNFPKGTIKIDDTILDVQIADTPDRMTEGLQFQKQLSYHQGMIFVFPESQIVAMWMKDMQFPLDMIWFDSNGNVVHIEKNLSPCNDSLPCQVYDGNRQSTKYVLEVTSGFVDKFNVTEKSKLTIINP